MNTTFSVSALERWGDGSGMVRDIINLSEEDEN